MFCSRSLLISIALLTAFPGHAVPVTDIVETEQQVNKFSAMPATCITLRQGRKCFATVTINLELSKLGDYCIYQQGLSEPLRCWKNAVPKVLSFAFESSQKTVYTLKDERSQQIIAKTSVEVSWVHQTISRKRRWRIF